MAAHDDEQLLNGELARLLREQGLKAKAEQRVGRKKLDVLVDIQGLRVVLEAEAGNPRQAVKEADKRLQDDLTTIAFAVDYPAGQTVDNLERAILGWSLRTDAARKLGQSAQWSSGSVADFAAAIKQSRYVFDVDSTAAELSEALDQAVARLSTPTRKDLAQRLDLPAGKDRKDGWRIPAKRAMLVIATAMLFHHRLHEHLASQQAPPEWRGSWPPMKASECAAHDNPLIAHRNAWEAILALDYRPVFATARTALLGLEASPDMIQTVRALAKQIEAIMPRTAGLRHDLLGRIFHRVLDTARYDGSFYTSTSAAVLLAGLALRPQDRDWSDPNQIANLRIYDPACGTGTLLMAASERIRDLRHAAAGGKLSDEDEAALALSLVEDVLWGYDINVSATHMAATTLGMLSPSTEFGRMNVFRTRLGMYKGKPRTGSLEFLDQQPVLIGWPQSPGVTQVDDDETARGADPPKMDLVIMNPPFTRDSLRHDQFSRKVELQIKAREKEILAQTEFRQAARLSGSANAFTVLGAKMLDKGKGTLALILPTAMTTNPAAIETRKYLARSFHVESIVSSHDPDRINMSENTSIGEVLIICRRWNEDGVKPPTSVYNLAANPSTAFDASTLLTQIRADEKRTYTLQNVDAERIVEGDWGAVNFLSPMLVNAYRAMNEADSTLMPLKRIADVGPAGQRIRDAFTRSEMPTPEGWQALWRHETPETQSMRAKPDSYLTVKESKKRLAEKYWSQRSVFLLPHRLWLPLSRSAAVVLDHPVLGSNWTPCRPHNARPSTALALCVFLNSSVGLLSLLGDRDNRKPSYPSFSLNTLRSLRVPNFETNRDAERSLAKVFESLKDEVLQALPLMDHDPIRKQLDAAVTEALNLDPEWVAQIRRELSREPSITNRRYAGFA